MPPFSATPPHFVTLSYTTFSQNTKLQHISDATLCKIKLKCAAVDTAMFSTMIEKSSSSNPRHQPAMTAVPNTLYQHLPGDIDGKTTQNLSTAGVAVQTPNWETLQSNSEHLHV